MKMRFGFSIAILSLFIGCGDREPDSARVPAASKGETPAAASDAALAATLSELTQTLRKFSAEQRRVPAPVSELVSAGYIKAVPAAPSGKTFGIDPKTLQVIVK